MPRLIPRPASVRMLGNGEGRETTASHGGRFNKTDRLSGLRESGYHSASAAEW
jgi:hypothetical protein